MQLSELDFTKCWIRRSLSRFMRSLSCLSQIGGKVSNERSKLWKRLTMSVLPNCMKRLNHISKSFWLWNMSMEDRFMDTSRASQTDRWQRLKPNTCGNRSSLEFTTSIKETLLIEISNWRIFYLMKLEPELNLLTLGFLLASLMKRKSRSFVELQATWHQRLLARLSMLDLQLISGHLVSFFMLSSVADSHSKDRMIRNFTRIYVNKNCLLEIIYQDKQSNFW